MEKKTKNEKMRVAKLISNSGFSSRRDAEKLIIEKRVKLNGKTIESPAINIDKNSIIEIDGKIIETNIRTQVWIFNKPKGCLVTKKDPQERATIYNFLPKQLQNTKTIGRLDYNSEGLLMLTNDGDFSRYIELPKNNFKRIYKVRVFGIINEKRLHNLSNGIKINGENFKPLDVIVEKRQKSNSWLNFTLYEGRNREIRKICKYMDLEVSRLIRYSYGPFNLGNLNKCGIKKVPHSFLIRKLPKFFK